MNWELILLKCIFYLLHNFDLVVVPHITAIVSHKILMLEICSEALSPTPTQLPLFQLNSFSKEAVLRVFEFEVIKIHQKYLILKCQKFLKKLVEYKLIGNCKSYKNTCHSRDIKMYSDEMERNILKICQYKLNNFSDETVKL